MGYGLIPCTHEPDWRLLSSNEAQNLMELVKDPKNVAPDVQLKCTAPVPPLLAIHLRRNNCIPEEIDNNAKRSLDPNMKSSMKEGAGLLLFTPHKYDVTAFQASFICLIKFICINFETDGFYTLYWTRDIIIFFLFC